MCDATVVTNFHEDGRQTKGQLEDKLVALAFVL